jgi:dCTP deaminase
MATIVISPWDDARLNPDSYNLSLRSELLVYECETLDAASPNRTRRLTIPDSSSSLASST